MFAPTTSKSAPVLWQGKTRDGYTLRLTRSGLAKIVSNLQQTGLHNLVQNNLNGSLEAAVVRAIAQVVSNATRSTSGQNTQLFTAIGRTREFQIMTQPMGHQQSVILFVRSLPIQEFENKYMDRRQAIYSRNFEQESPLLEGEYMFNPFKRKPKAQPQPGQKPSLFKKIFNRKPKAQPQPGQKPSLFKKIFNRKAKPPSLTPSRFSEEYKKQQGDRSSVDTHDSPPGYMLHGTSQENADKILKKGLKKSRGGKEGGASKKYNDQEFIKRSKGVVHGTTSRGVAAGYARYLGGEDEKNQAVLGFRNVHPDSTNKDDDSPASHTIGGNIPPNQVVQIPREKVDTWPVRFP